MCRKQDLADVPTIGSLKREIEQQPLCQDEVGREGGRVCGTKPDNKPAHRLCTWACKTQQAMHWQHNPPYCEVGWTLARTGPRND